MYSTNQHHSGHCVKGFVKIYKAAAYPPLMHSALLNGSPRCKNVFQGREPPPETGLPPSLDPVSLCPAAHLLKYKSI